MSYASIVKDLKLSGTNSDEKGTQAKKKQEPKEMAKIFEEETTTIGISDDERIKLFTRLLISSEYDLMSNMRKIRSKFKEVIDTIVNEDKKEELRQKYREFLVRMKSIVDKCETDLKKTQEP